MNIKHTYLFLLLFIFTLGLITPTAVVSASTQTYTENIKTMDSNGGYWVETITTSAPASTSRASYATYAASTTQTATKTTKYYNSNNELCWQYSLTAQFRVNKGTSVTCVDSSAKLSIYKSSYTLSSEKHSHSGNKATGTIRIKHNGVTKAKTITITCSKNGTIS